MLILLTGGSANGKSTYAEALCARLGGPLYYIAAMLPYGEESARRIVRHRRMRAARGFETMERYTDVAGLTLPGRGTALLECLCNLTANEIFEPNGAHEGAEEAVVAGVRALRAQCAHLIVVTNDVGSDGGGYDELTERYIGTLGRVNRRLAAEADTVCELVCGIPLPLKGALL